MTTESQPNTTFDTFYSPQNVPFYASKPYLPLPTTEKHIRLIKVLPGQRNDAVECLLLPPQPLQDAEYLALSYCAGDPNVTEPLTVNGVQFNAFASLEGALRRLRLRPEEYDENKPPALIWADQVCIDQSNPVERAHQVGFMRDIYEQAGRVMVWLGGKGKGEVGLRWMQGQHGNLEEIVGALNLDVQDQDEDTLAAVDYAAEMLGKTLVEKHFDDSELVEAWMGVREVVFSEWWSRCWVAQELIVSRNAVILVGDATMYWDDFKVAHTVVRSVVRAVLESLLSRNRDDPTLEQDLVHLKAMVGGWDSGVEFMIEQQSEWQKGNPIPIKTLLEHARIAKASDPRDRIYAFLGLAAPTYSVVPSYEPSNSLFDTLCHTSKRIVLHDSSLEILSFAQAHTPDGAALPSWTPNWCLPIDRLPITADEYSASGSYPAFASFHADSQGAHDRILRVAGIFIDSVAAQASELQLNKTRTGDTVRTWMATMDLDIEDASQTSEVYFTGELLTAALLATAYLGKHEPSEEVDARTDLDDFQKRRVREQTERENKQLLERATDGQRCFFCTPKRYIGLANAVPLHTDLVVVLFGARVPFVVRKVGEQYRLIGEAYIHGFMDGEAVEMMRRGEVQVEYIDII